MLTPTTFLLIATLLVLFSVCWAVTARILHTVQQLGDNGGNSISFGGVAYDVTAEGCTTINVEIAANQTDKEIAVAFAYANLAAIILVPSVDMLLETNDGTTPDDDFPLKAGKAFVWDKENGMPNPFTANVTKFLVTNTAAGTLKGFIFETDTTP